MALIASNTLKTVTPITSLNFVDYTNSPLNLEFSADVSTKLIQLNIWVWNGDINTPLSYSGTPTEQLYGYRISADDTYINFEVSDIIRSHITPTLNYSVTGSTSSIFSNEGVYWQFTAVEVKTIESGLNNVNYNPQTRFATKGWNWNYQGQKTFDYNHGAFGFETPEIVVRQNPEINYYDAIINLSAATNTSNMVVRTIDPPNFLEVICVGEGWTIIYLDKNGLFQYYSPAGKVTVSVDIERSEYQRSFRRPLSVSPKNYSTTQQYNITPKQSYKIMSGYVKEDVGQIIEEIMYSSQIYLIQYLGDSSTQLFTADNTLITVDSTLFTADLTKIQGKYITFRQIPVVCTNKSFDRKTRINDRIKINYQIQLEEGNIKINNIK